MASEPTVTWLSAVEGMESSMVRALTRFADWQDQRLDLAASRLGRPSSLAHRHRLTLGNLAQRLQHASRIALRDKQSERERFGQLLLPAVQRALQRSQERTQRAELRLHLPDPALVLKRGYAWLTLENGHTLSSVSQAYGGQRVKASLADGTVDLTVSH